MFSSSSGHFLLKDALRNNSTFHFTVHICLHCVLELKKESDLGSFSKVAD